MASKVVIILILILDIIAFGLAVNAERTRSTAQVLSDREMNYWYCQYNTGIVATGYGLGAFFCLLVSQIVLMAASRCLCCGKGMEPGGSRTCATTLFIFCWLTFITAEVCLLVASVRNGYHTKFRAFIGDNPPSCMTIRKGVFAAGAAFTFFTAIFSEFYYISYSNVLRCQEKNTVKQNDPSELLLI